MTDQKIVAVVGATGQQGGGLVRATLEERDPAFRVRAITRDVGSAKARELARLGVEVVRADLDDEESLKEAFEGAYAAFLLTNYWEHLSADRELEQAGNLARAAAAAGVSHAIWSTLEDTRESVPLDDDALPTVAGRYKVPHFDAKGEADALFAEAGVPTTFLRTTFFWEDFTSFFPPRRQDGSIVLALPMAGAKLAGIAVEDIGRVALGILRRGPELVGQTVSIAGEHLTGSEIAGAFTDVLGEPVRYVPVPFDAFRAGGFPAAVELGNMFQYYAEFADEFTGSRDLDEVRALDPSLVSFRDWLVAHKDAFAGL